MTDLDALLAAVLAGADGSRDDDTRRLVYADCLENGEIERAEFIRAGVRMGLYTDCPMLLRDRARGRPSPFRCGECDYCTARMECERLAAAALPAQPFPFAYTADCGLVPPDWHDRCAEMATGSGGPLLVYARGFWDRVYCSAEFWLRWGDDIRRAHPVTRVRLTTFTGSDRIQIIRRVPVGMSVTGRLFSELFGLVWPGVAFELPTTVVGIDPAAPGADRTAFDQITADILTRHWQAEFPYGDSPEVRPDPPA